MLMEGSISCVRLTHIQNLKPTYPAAWLILERMWSLMIKNIKKSIIALSDKRAFIYSIRILSWSALCLYAYLGFSYYIFFDENSYLSLILVFLFWGSNYKVRYSEIFWKRLCRVLLEFVVFWLMVGVMYLIVVY